MTRCWWEEEEEEEEWTPVSLMMEGACLTSVEPTWTHSVVASWVEGC